MTNLSQLQQARKELAQRELARRNLLDFIKYNFPSYNINWHHRLLAKKLEGVANGTIKKLAVFMPPRNGKSEQCSIQFPAWILGKKPQTKIIMASYSQDLATDFGRKTRNLVNTQEYKNVFNISLSQDSKSAGRWNTDANGFYTATGIGGGATGKGADVLIIDDPHKNRKEADSPVKRKEVLEWYRSTAKTRLSPDGATILILTRWHDADLAGSIIDDTWEVIELKAIAEEDDDYRKKGEALWPSQFPLKWLQAQKRDIGSFEFSSLYQQTPLDPEHAEFKSKYFTSISLEAVKEKQTHCFLTIDTAVSKATTGDFTAFIENWIDIKGDWHIKATRYKIDASELISKIFEKYKANNYVGIGIEETIFTQAIQPFLTEEQIRRGIFLPISRLKHNSIAKEIRIRGLLPRYEAKTIFHIEDECDDLESELLRFPKSTHDDLSDALAYQSQIAYSPQKEETRMQQVYNEMQVDDRTGYLT